MAIETREIPIPYEVWKAMKDMIGMVIYSSYSDPTDMHGTGLATMETSYNMGDNYIPLIRAKTTWKLDQDWFQVPGSEKHEYFMTIPVYIEDDDQYDYPDSSPNEYGQITDASPDGC